MFSIRELRRIVRIAAAVGSVALTMGAITGCQFHHNSGAEPGDTDITMNDEADLHRVWTRSHAEYANQTVIAGGVGDAVKPKEETPDYQRLVLEPSLFWGNTIILPITMVLYPPGRPVDYRGDTYAPTYTGNGFAQMSGAIIVPSNEPAPSGPVDTNAANGATGASGASETGGK